MIDLGLTYFNEGKISIILEKIDVVFHVLAQNAFPQFVCLKIDIEGEENK